MFSEYWSLLRTDERGPEDGRMCTYRVEWIRPLANDVEDLLEESRAFFKLGQAYWTTCENSKAFIAHLAKSLPGANEDKKVTNIICFGLGDIGLKPLG